MSILFSDITSHHIRAHDGEIGSVHDVLFDDQSWNLRYFVVDTARWLPSRKVLISPASFSVPGRTDDRVLVADLTKEQIKNSPDLSTDAPVSRQYEEALHSFYGWTPYWTVPMTLSGWPYPDATILSSDRNRDHSVPEMWNTLAHRRSERFDSHLRSMKEVKGYKIESADGEAFGEVEDAVLNADQWSVIDLVLNSNRWLPGGKRVVCSPMLVSDISESDRVLHVSLSKEVLMSGPEFDFESYGESYRQQMVSSYLRERDVAPRGSTSFEQTQL